MTIEFFAHIKGEYFCLSTKDEKGQWRDQFFHRDELHKMRAFLKNNADKDIYWCPHGFKKAGSRKKDNAVLDCWAYADLDEADPRKIPLRPTIAIQSSPGRFVGLWKFDQTITEEFNRAITRYVEADPSGYDLGQVLRVPGTRNYKYARMPKVDLMWDDGVSYRIDRVRPLVSHLMKAPEKKDSPASATAKAQTIFNKFIKVDQEVRSTVLKPSIHEDTDRSAVLWKLTNSYIEAGATVEEVVTLLEATIWNKFRGKEGSHTKLKRDVERCLEKKGEAGGLTTSEDQTLFDPTQVPGYSGPLSAFSEKDLTWIWHKRLPRSGIVFLEGDSGVGKSFASHLICASLCSGTPLPDRGKKDIPGPFRVMYFDHENDLEAVTIARLKEAGLTKEGQQRFYPVSRSQFRTQGYDLLSEEGFQLIRRGIRDYKIDVVVFDVMNNYATDRYNENDANSVARLGSALEKLCFEFGVCIIGVRHLNKKTDSESSVRGAGSYKIKSIPRVVLGIGYHPEESDQRRLVLLKHNNSSPANALNYKIESKTSNGQERAYPSWADVAEYDHKDDVYKNAQAQPSGSIGPVKCFIRSLLKNGPKTIDKVKTMCGKRGFQDTDIDKAADELELIVSGTARTKYWELPEND